MPDFNNAGPQKSFDVIPAGTIATLHLTVRPGHAGEDGWLRRSKNGDSEMLDCELTVVDGPFAKRKFWSLMIVSGTTDGQAQAGEISRAKLRAILESARGIRPDATGEVAQQARHIASYGDLDGLRFIGRIGVERARDGYPAKNNLLEAITPDRKDWHRIEQVAKPPGAGPTSAPPGAAPTSAPAAKPSSVKSEPVKIEKPEWAK